MNQPAPWEVKKEETKEEEEIKGKYEDYEPKGDEKECLNVDELIRNCPKQWKLVEQTDSKPTNPKDAIGSDKLPLHLVPSALNIYASLAFLEGAVKYGCFNWRVAGVRMSIYLSALERHLRKFQDGEWADEKTGVPHLSSMLACIGIILDAKLVGKLTDDRPPVAPTADLIEALEAHVPVLKALFKDRHPHQHTIMDQESR